MQESNFPLLGPSAYHILMGSPSDLTAFVEPVTELQRLSRKSRVESAMQIHLDVFTDSEWDQLREIFVRTDGVVAGATVAACLTSSGHDGPFEIYAGEWCTREILQFIDETPFTFDTTLPESEQLDSPTENMWKEFSNSNTNSANRNPYTPTINDGACVANVYNFTGPNDRKIQVVSGVVSSVHLVLSMCSTMYMNMITAWDIVMAYPQLTLDRREAIDTVHPQGARLRTTPPFFDMDGILVNPLLTAYDVVGPGAEVTVLPRCFGDVFTLRIALPGIPLPYDDTLPGSRAALYSNTWQLRFGPDNLMSVQTTHYRHPFLSNRMLLSPTIEAVLLPKLPSEWKGVASSNATDNTPDDDLFLVLLREAYEEMLSLESPYIRIVTRIAAEMQKWNSMDCHVPLRLVPSAGVAYVCFKTLSNLRAGLDGSARVQFLFRTLPEVNEHVWSYVVVRVHPNTTSTRSDYRIEQVPGIQELCMTIRLEIFDGSSGLLVPI